MLVERFNHETKQRDSFQQPRPNTGQNGGIYAKIELLNEDWHRVMARYPDTYFDLACGDPLRMGLESMCQWAQERAGLKRTDPGTRAEMRKQLQI